MRSLPPPPMNVSSPLPPVSVSLSRRPSRRKVPAPTIEVPVIVPPTPEASRPVSTTANEPFKDVAVKAPLPPDVSCRLKPVPKALRPAEKRSSSALSSSRTSPIVVSPLRLNSSCVPSASVMRRSDEMSVTEKPPSTASLPSRRMPRSAAANEPLSAVTVRSPPRFCESRSNSELLVSGSITTVSRPGATLLAAISIASMTCWTVVMPAATSTSTMVPSVKVMRMSEPTTRRTPSPWFKLASGVLPSSLNSCRSVRRTSPPPLSSDSSTSEPPSTVTPPPGTLLPVSVAPVPVPSRPRSAAVKDPPADVT